MSDGHDRSYEAGVDREISLKGIVWTGLVLAAVVVLSGVLMWYLSGALRSSLIESDPPPPVLIEAQTQELPPEPRLQTKPEDDMRLLRAEEEAALNAYSWVNEAAGVAQVPIARAMEMLANGEASIDVVPETAGEDAAEPAVAPGEEAAASGEGGDAS